MRTPLIVVVCLALAGAALAAPNEIGIYTAPTADPAEASYNGTPGSFTAYVVLTDPVSDHTGLPIATVGGFEFRLNLPANVFLLNTMFPPATTNFATSPEFLCGANIPVVDGRATLITLTVGEFSGTPGEVFMAPVFVAPPSVAGNIAITDYDDDFRISVAHPSSGSFDAAVFGVYMGVVPTEDTAWGEVKALFR